MRIQYYNSVWKTSPFIRVLVPLIGGVILQWYLQLPLTVIVITFICASVDLVLFRLLPLSAQYKTQFLQGLAVNLMLLSFGLFITWQKDVRNHDNWFGNYYKNGDYLTVRIDEPPIEKTKSSKVDGYVKLLIHNDTAIHCEGKILLYFSKEVTKPVLHYGDIVLIHKNLQTIKNSGNPGAFNYERYAAFEQTFHNVFLKKEDWILLNEKDVNYFKQFIFFAREYILSVIRKNIKNDNDEFGIAEALLIGYNNDLDKDLVQAYSNTGVVHVIAVSGMHLGIIYLTITWLLNKISFFKRSKIIKIITLLSCLWILAFVTGASASVFRSAVMFTFIAIAKGINKKSSIYNSLAASAFVLLCCDPYFLWDVGFQLSYLAVISIIVFQKPIYNLFYVKNKWLNKLWEIASVTLAVQVLLFPIDIYYFHQFPLLFFFTNIIIIPLSIIILYVEILLVVFAKIPYIGLCPGKVASFLISLMNKFIVWVNSLSFSVIDNLSATVLSIWILYAMVICYCAWFINKNKILLRLALFFTLFFAIIIAWNDFNSMKQTKMIVYNVPQHKAIDFINGNDYQFAGDSILLADGMLQNFHLKPGRISMQLTNRLDSLPTVFSTNNFYQFQNNRIIFIDKQLPFTPADQKIKVDVIVISKNPKLYIPQLAKVFDCTQYVADASNSLWKIDKWKKDCEKLHLRFYSVPDEGAFVLNVDSQ